MRKSAIGLLALGAAAALALSACSSSKKSSNTTGAAAPSSGTSSSTSSSAAKGGKVGWIMPDTQSSNRWVTSDPQAILAECKVKGLTCDVKNANNSASQMKTIAESMMTNGVKVLGIVNLDSASAAAIESEAASKGVITIDYDRLTLGGKASLYVSFDNVAVGTHQGQALVKCPQVQGKSAVNYVDLNGSKTDNNATLFKQGYDGVLSKQTGWKKLDDQWVADWDNQQAGVTFASMLTSHPNLNAVMVANDGMANSVIAQLKKQHLNGKVAVSGQDATVQGLQHILDGDQCFTIYKPSKLEAVAAVDAAADFVAGNPPQTTQTIKDTQTGQEKPAVLSTPITITKSNVDEPVKDGYVAKAQLCAGAYAAKCTAAGVS